MRLDRYLANAGEGSRSNVKKLIASGRVRAGDKIIKDPAFQVDSMACAVSVDGRPVRYNRTEYYMLNKPKGVISASRDGHGDRCAVDLIESGRSDLFPAGRLDRDTEGLLLVTNDGQLCHALLSPKRHVPKTYLAELDGPLSKEAADRIMAGVDIGDEKPAMPCVIEMVSASVCRITVYEGRFHEVKRIFKTEHLTVTSLKRLSMGPLTLDPTLAPGAYRPLTGEEIAMLADYTHILLDTGPDQI